MGPRPETSCWTGAASTSCRPRPGVAFGVVTLILLIGSINYMLQLGYLLTFLVASMAVVGMHNTHSNLAQIVLRGVQVEPVYAGDVAAFEINVTNPTTVDRFALRFSFATPSEHVSFFSRFFSKVNARARTADHHH